MSGADRLNRAMRATVSMFRPPERLTLRQWTEERRRMSPGVSSAAGPWRTNRAPWLAEIMDAYSDDNVRHIAAMFPRQSAKSELLLNIIGHTIDINPCGILYVQPTIEDVKSFSKLRVAPLLKDNPCLRGKVKEVKSRDSGNTVTQKQFPAGFLRMVTALSPTNLRSTPCAIVIVDELSGCRDTVEGKLQTLVEEAAKTFPNSKIVYTSTPTTKGACKIDDEYRNGTMELWMHRCPCGEWVEARLNDKVLLFDHEVIERFGKREYRVSNIRFKCPHCGLEQTEVQVKNSPFQWVAQNPDAYGRWGRSFALSGMYTRLWEEIVVKLLECEGEPKALQAFKNTVLGELWENRTYEFDENALLERREEYGTLADGKTPADAPNDVLMVSLAVDVQKDRLEYEFAGWGFSRERWGIEYGVIDASPLTDEAWARFDGLLDRRFRRADGKELRVTIAGVDSNYISQEVYRRVYERRHRRVFAIRGKSGYEDEFLPLRKYMRKKTRIDGLTVTIDFAPLGVNEGKEHVMQMLAVETPGPKYCHFPLRDDAGYGRQYFRGLLAEERKLFKTSGGMRWGWVNEAKRPNEPLDLFNYNLALLLIENPDMQARQAELNQWKPRPAEQAARAERERGEERLARRQQDAMDRIVYRDGEW